MTDFVNHALAARIDAAQAAQLSALVQTIAARLPGCGVASASIAGGTAAFIMPHISLSRAVGLGMRGVVEAADAEALETFYRSRDTEARILVSPFADASLFERLGERAFALADFDTVLVRRIERAEPFALPPGITVRRAALDDAAAWVHTSLAGFAPPGHGPDQDRAPFLEAGFHDPTASFFSAEVGGVVAGGGALHLHGTTAHFFADSTLPAFRGKGVQGALIAARLALARDAGCDLAFAVTAAGSASQRNFERAGFAPGYSQALLMKRFG